jgi:hypothetical protein
MLPARYENGADISVTPCHPLSYNIKSATIGISPSPTAKISYMEDLEPRKESVLYCIADPFPRTDSFIELSERKLGRRTIQSHYWKWQLGDICVTTATGSLDQTKILMMEQNETSAKHDVRPRAYLHRSSYYPSHRSGLTDSLNSQGSELHHNKESAGFSMIFTAIME